MIIDTMNLIGPDFKKRFYFDLHEFTLLFECFFSAPP